MSETSRGSLENRARRWRWSAHEEVCDSIISWAHGTVARASRYPDYYDFNLVRVEDDPGVDPEALRRAANELLAGLAHRLICFDLIDPAERMRGDFVAHGWRATRLVWMHFEGGSAPEPDGPDIAEVSYDAVHPLRVAWHDEDYPDTPETEDFYRQAHEVATARDVQVLAAHRDRELVGFAQLERNAAGAEITQVYVKTQHRGAGVGTALTSAAIGCAGNAEDLWICADDEATAKELYARLGFRPAWTAMDFLRLPEG